MVPPAPPPPTPRSARRRGRQRRTRRRATVTGALILVIGVAVAAFAISGTRGHTASTAKTTTKPVPTTTTLPPTTTTTRDPRRGDGQAVTIAFGGDVHFEGAIRAKLLANPNTVFTPVTPVLSSADIAMVNLESAITDSNTPVPKAFNFKAPATALDALRAAGIDVVTEANNHGEDYGPRGLADSLAAIAAKQFPVLGIGANATQAYAPYTVQVKGQRIGILAATDVIDGQDVKAWTATDSQGGIASTKDASQARMVAAIQALRPQVDTLVVFLHWGTEHVGCATPRQKALARALVDAGADVVVGSHAHVLLGGGRLGGAFVDYGLGNFAFYNEAGDNGRTGVLMLTMTGRTVDSYQFLPARIRGGIPNLIPAGPGADAEVAHWNSLRACTDLTP